MKAADALRAFRLFEKSAERWIKDESHNIDAQVPDDDPIPGKKDTVLDPQVNVNEPNLLAHSL